MDDDERAKFVGALLLLRHARHMVGSPASHIFQLGTELSAALHFVNIAQRHLNHTSSTTSSSSGRDRKGGTSDDASRGSSREFKLEEESWDAQLMRMWSVDVPLSAGSFGLLGANIRPTTSLNLTDTLSDETAGILAIDLISCVA